MINNLKDIFKETYYKLEVKRLLLKERICNIKDDNKGVAIIEIILILVIVLGLIVIFRKKIIELATTVFKSITKSGNNITSEIKIK